MLATKKKSKECKIKEKEELQHQISKGFIILQFQTHHYTVQFKSQPTEWGQSHESLTIESYKKEQMQKHSNFKLEKCGLYIDSEYSFLGSSPV